VLHSAFNTAQNYQIDIDVLDEIPSVWLWTWGLFLEEKFISSITKCNNLFTPGLDKLLWRYFKSIVKNKGYLKSIINIANICFELDQWSSHFKKSTTIIILKPNKELCNSFKSFRPIIFFNILEKLIRKVIGECFQLQVILNNFIHMS